LINNRQNGRRRGRGGGAPRPNGPGGGPDRGNRLDNRARGNAAQLHEKYKTLARDAQMQGDRVNAEYYLQFADHYFRVLSENRARFEDQQQRPRRDDYQGQADHQPQGDYQGPSDDQDEYEDEGDVVADMAHTGNGHADNGDRGGNRQDRFERQNRFERPDRFDRAQRAERYDRVQRAEPNEQAERAGSFEDQPRQQRRGRGTRAEGREVRGEAPLPVNEEPIREAPQVDDVRAERPRRGRRSRAEAAPVEGGDERIEVDRLPPAFASDAPLLDGVVEPAPSTEEKPRRRTRRPRNDAVTAEA